MAINHHFNVKYGHNVLHIPLPNGDSIHAEFEAKYGLNKIEIPINGSILTNSEKFRYGKYIKYGEKRYGTNFEKIYDAENVITVAFELKYGENEVQVPITISDKVYLDFAKGLSSLFDETFTIFNQIPTSQKDASIRTWKKHYIGKCDKRDGIFDKSNGTMAYNANSWTVTCKRWENYKNPLWVNGGYYMLAEYEKDNFWTANVGDLIIFAKVDDVAPTNVQEFQKLKAKYNANGGQITSAQEYIHFKPNGKPWKTNHIEMIKG